MISAKKLKPNIILKITLRPQLYFIHYHRLNILNFKKLNAECLLKHQSMLSTIYDKIDNNNYQIIALQTVHNNKIVRSTKFAA